MGLGGWKRKKKGRYRPRPKWGYMARPFSPSTPAQEKRFKIPLPIPRNKGRDALGRLSGWLKPKSEEPPPPIRVGAPTTMNLGMTQKQQERQLDQWRRLPGERLFRRLFRRFGPRPYRPPRIPKGQYKAEIIGQ